MAHNPLTGSTEERLAGLLSAALLGGMWLLYLRGSILVRPSLGRAILFHVTALLCAVTVLGPLDDLAKTSTAAHMSQHMLLMVVIAPLWVLSKPMAQLRAAGSGLAVSPWRAMVIASTQPMTAAWVHAAVIWFWHLPVFYMLAVENPWWHSVEHLLFVVTAGMFWWAVLHSSLRRLPLALASLLFTLMHTGFLGALLTFSRTTWYGEARSLADQQLAGMIMWVVAALPYLLALVWLSYRAYRYYSRGRHSVGENTTGPVNDTD